jgi:hypothetical protein
MRAREESHKRRAKCHAFSDKIDYSIRAVEHAAMGHRDRSKTS